MVQKRAELKILALDQSTKITGWSLWEGTKLLKYGVLSSDVHEDNPIERMNKMYALVDGLVADIKPRFIVIEQVQFQNNYRVYSQLSQLQGVLFAVTFRRNLPFTLIEPTAWKAFFGVELRGKKRPEQKADTIRLVRERYGVEVSEDEADAIGIGYWASRNITKS